MRWSVLGPVHWEGLQMAEAQIPHGYKQTEAVVPPEDWEVTAVGNKFVDPTRQNARL